MSLKWEEAVGITFLLLNFLIGQTLPFHIHESRMLMGLFDFEVIILLKCWKGDNLLEEASIPLLIFLSKNHVAF